MGPPQLVWIQPSVPKLGSLSPCRIKSRSGLDHIPVFCPFTFVLQVPHVQDGSQQLGDLPVLRVGEHQDLHCRADVGVLLAIISAITSCAVTLGRRRGRTARGVKQRASGLDSTLSYPGLPPKSVDILFKG